jgi:small subunit ribosomal protein S21
MKLKQLALISTPEPRLIVIQPFDASTTKDVERAIKALKRKVAQEGIYKELKRRRFYEKPSVKTKRKQREAERRRRKERRRALKTNVRAPKK